LDLILRAYRAEKTDGFATFHGKKAGRLVSVGPVNMPVTRLYVEEVIAECRQKRITRVDILGFEFEMGLFPNVLDEARAKGIDIAPKYIPAEVFDKRAVEKNQVRSRRTCTPSLGIDQLRKSSRWSHLENDREENGTHAPGEEVHTIPYGVRLEVTCPRPARFVNYGVACADDNHQH